MKRLTAVSLILLIAILPMHSATAGIFDFMKGKKSQHSDTAKSTSKPEAEETEAADAKETSSHHDMHAMKKTYKHSANATKEYRAAMRKMHYGMDISSTGNPNEDFAASMVAHHQGAVAMADVELRYGRDPQVRTLAENIQRWQSVEIGQMQRWLDRRGYYDRMIDPYQPDAPRYVSCMAHAAQRMHEGMDICYSGNADTDFLRGMIPHHQGAIDMAQIYLKHGTDQELLELAREVVRSQSQEIALMQEWLEANGVPHCKLNKPSSHKHH